MKLFKGRAAATGATSPKSLYDTKLASFAMSGYDVTAARGFIDAQQLARLAEQAGKSDYGQYLLRVLRDAEGSRA